MREDGGRRHVDGEEVSGPPTFPGRGGCDCLYRRVCVIHSPSPHWPCHGVHDDFRRCPPFRDRFSPSSSWELFALPCHPCPPCPRFSVTPVPWVPFVPLPPGCDDCFPFVLTCSHTCTLSYMFFIHVFLDWSSYHTTTASPDSFFFRILSPLHDPPRFSFFIFLHTLALTFPTFLLVVLTISLVRPINPVRSLPPLFPVRSLLPLLYVLYPMMTEGDHLLPG